MSAEHYDDGDVVARKVTVITLVSVLLFASAALTILLVTGS